MPLLNVEVMPPSLLVSVIVAPICAIAATLLFLKSIEILHQTRIVWFARGGPEVKMLKVMALIVKFPGGSRWTQWLASPIVRIFGKKLSGKVYRYPLLMATLAIFVLFTGHIAAKVGLSMLIALGIVAEFLFLLAHRIKLGAYDNMIIAIETQWGRIPEEDRLADLMQREEVREIIRSNNPDEQAAHEIAQELYATFDFTRSKLMERIMLLYMSSFFVLILGFAAMYTVFLQEHWWGSDLATTTRADVDWFQASYFSVITQVTVGYGDIAPTGVIPRTVVVVQIGIGFALFVLLLSAITSTLDLERAVTGDKTATTGEARIQATDASRYKQAIGEQRPGASDVPGGGPTRSSQPVDTPGQSIQHLAIAIVVVACISVYVWLAKLIKR